MSSDYDGAVAVSDRKLRQANGKLACWGEAERGVDLIRVSTGSEFYYR